MTMRRLDTSLGDFDRRRRPDPLAGQIWTRTSPRRVTAIIADVASRGDDAVLEYTARFDRLSAGSLAELEVSGGGRPRRWSGIARAARDALEYAADRIVAITSTRRSTAGSTATPGGQPAGPADNAVGAGGYLRSRWQRPAIPSSVLMNACPPGSPVWIVMVVPAPAVNSMTWSGCGAVAEVDRVFTIGGAQAVAALAHGTATIPAVDKIVGPGNIYVAAAKRQVFGRVGIDMVAGPSEILVICDGTTDPDWVADGPVFPGGT